jgi:hypothetical protein
LANSQKNLTNPEYFYDLQLLETIRLDAEHYMYYRVATESPIPGKADKLTVRRMAPLQGHTVPLEEGVPPVSDKGSLENYEMEAKQYGRYMEFTDAVDFKVVNNVVAHYTQEYGNVIMETLDMLARNALLTIAQKRFAGGAADITEMRIATGKPLIADLRLIVLSMKKALVKPMSGANMHVIVSVDFAFDMLDDPYVQAYMTINNSTHGQYDAGATLIPMFGLEFYETLACITSGEYIDELGKKCILTYKEYDAVADAGEPWEDTLDADGYVYRTFDEDDAGIYTEVSGYVNDPRTGLPGSYIPNQTVWVLPAGWNELKLHHIMVLGKDALTRTGLQGEGQAKMYVKALGSAGTLDPIDQRQSIGFKINSVGFASTRLEAVVDYVCIPTQSNV